MLKYYYFLNSRVGIMSIWGHLAKDLETPALHTGFELTEPALSNRITSCCGVSWSTVCVGQLLNAAQNVATFVTMHFLKINLLKRSKSCSNHKDPLSTHSVQSDYITMVAIHRGRWRIAPPYTVLLYISCSTNVRFSFSLPILAIYLAIEMALYIIDTL